MTALLRLGAFGLVLAVVFVAALAVGRALGPLDDDHGDPSPRPPATTTTTHHH